MGWPFVDPQCNCGNSSDVNFQVSEGAAGSRTKNCADACHVVLEHVQ